MINFQISIAITMFLLVFSCGPEKHDKLSERLEKLNNSDDNVSAKEEEEDTFEDISEHISKIYFNAATKKLLFFLDDEIANKIHGSDRISYKSRLVFSNEVMESNPPQRSSQLLISFDDHVEDHEICPPPNCTTTNDPFEARSLIVDLKDGLEGEILVFGDNPDRVPRRVLIDKENIITLDISKEREECQGEGTLSCMLVKENGEDEEQLLYPTTFLWPSGIGASIQAGYEYKLKVQSEHLIDPPADASSIIYHILEYQSNEPRVL